MEKDMTFGSLGKASLSFSGGKAILSAQAAIDGNAVSVSAGVSIDAGIFIDQLEAIVAKALPASALIDPMIFGQIKKAVLSVT